MPLSVISAPQVSGSPLAGAALIASHGTYSGSVTSYTYQWYCDYGAGYIAVGGATNNTFAPGSAEVGHPIKFGEVATGPDGTASENLSLATAPIGTDSFTSATDTLLSSYTGPLGAWAKSRTADGATVSIVSATGRARSSSASTSTVYYLTTLPDTLGTDYRVSASIFFTSADMGGVGARTSGPGSGSDRSGYFLWWDSSVSQWKITLNSVTGGVTLTLGTYTGLAPATGVTRFVELEVTGAGATVTLKGYVDNTLIIEASDTSATRIVARRFPAIYAVRQAAEFDTFSVTPIGLSTDPSGVVTLASDACWTWYNSPNSVTKDGIVYTGAVNSSGRINVTKNDNGVTSTVTWGTTTQVDDHVNPALLVMPSGKLLVIYSVHNGSLFYRLSTNALPNITAFDPEVTIYTAGGANPANSYANVSLMPDGYVRIFAREGSGGVGTNPTRLFKKLASEIEAGDTTWAAPVQQWGITNNRPYPKYAVDSVNGRIDIFTSTDHPNEGNASLYHYYIMCSGGTEAYYKSDGTAITASLPFDPSAQGTLIMDYSAGNNWTWDVKRASDGTIYAASTKYPGRTGVITRGTVFNDIEYWLHRYSGGAWTSFRLSTGQQSLYGQENCYAGGIAIDGVDHTLVYASEVSGTVNEINLYRVNWSGTPSKTLVRAITSGSATNQNRPFSMKGHGARQGVVWWDGTYTAYTSYSTRVRTVAASDGAVAAPSDTTPDAFTFTDQTDVALSSVVTSNTITISGINAATAISITGGEYQIGTGAWVTASGTVTNGQTVTVRHTSSASFSAATNTVLTIGGVSDTFTSTTLAADTTPDAFSFTTQTNVALSTLVTSNSITVSGINSAATISVTGGEYQIGGGSWVTASGTITNGQTVAVRHTSAATGATATVTTLTIGGVAGTFTSQTLSPLAPPPTGFSRKRARNLLFEVTPTGSGGTPTSLRMSRAGVSSRGSNINSQFWTPVLVDGPKRTVRLFNTDSGELDSIEISHGALTFLADSSFSNQTWSTLSWEGAPAKVWVGFDGDDWASYQQIFEGRVGPLERSGQLAKVTLLGAEADLNIPLLNASYDGTGGLEGPANLKGNPKPWASGFCQNVAPVLIDPVNWIYQVHAYGAVNNISVVYENAIDLGPVTGADAASYAALVGLALDPGQWAKCTAQGLFRLGAEPSGKITADVEGAKDTGTYVATLGSIAQHLLKWAGVPPAKIDSASLGGFGQPWSFYTTDPVQIGEVVRGAFAQAGGYVFPNSTAVWTAGSYFADLGLTTLLPSGLVTNVDQIATTPPAYRVKVGGDRCFSVHSDTEISSLFLDQAGEAVTFSLSNDSDIVLVNAAGVVDYTGTGGTFQVWADGVDKSATGEVTYAKGTETGLTATISSTGVYSISAVTAGKASVIFTATYNGVTYPATYKVNRRTDGKKLSLRQTGLGFKFDNTGNPVAGQTITINADREVTTGTPVWTVKDAGGNLRTPLATYLTVAGDGLSATLSGTQFNAGRNGTEYVEISAAIAADNLTDTQRYYRIKDGDTGAPGTSAVYAALSNELDAVAADASGNVSSYAGTGGTYQVWNGTTEVTGSSTFSVLSETGVDVSINATTGVYTVNSLTADKGTATLRAVYAGNTRDSVYTITKSKAGSGGVASKLIKITPSSSVFKYDTTGAVAAQTITFSAKRQNTSASTVWTIKDRANTVLSTGSATTVAASGYFTRVDDDTLTMTHTQFASFISGQPTRELFKVEAAITDGVTVSDIVTVSKIADGAAGAKGDKGDQGIQGPAGLNNQVVYAYQRSSSGAPALPSVSATYTFSTKSLTGLNNGWTATIPAGTTTLYVTAATASSATDVDSIASTEWAAARQFSGNDGSNGSPGSPGSPGLNGISVFLFQRNNTGTAPAAPSVSTTYTFSTKTLSGANNGWTQAMPDPASGKYAFVTSATALSTTDIDTIASTEWAAVKQFVKDGEDGAAGAPGLTVSPATGLTIACFDNGNVKSGELPRNFNITVYAGTTNVSASATYSVSNTNCTVVSNGGGSFTLSAVTANTSSTTITVTYGGASINQVWTFTKVPSGSSATSASATVSSMTGSTSYVVAQSVDLAVNVGATINGNFFATYHPNVPDTSSGSYEATGYLTLQALPSGTETQISSVVVGGFSENFPGDVSHNDGSISINGGSTNSTGAVTTFRLRLYLKKSSGISTGGTIVNGPAQLQIQGG